mgnify:FL=1
MIYTVEYRFSFENATDNRVCKFHMKTDFEGEVLPRIGERMIRPLAPSEEDRSKLAQWSAQYGDAAKVVGIDHREQGAKFTHVNMKPKTLFPVVFVHAIASRKKALPPHSSVL